MFTEIFVVCGNDSNAVQARIMQIVGNAPFEVVAQFENAETQAEDLDTNAFVMSSGRFCTIIKL